MKSKRNLTSSLFYMAENSVPESGSIASFDSLDRDVEKQTVDVGTELLELALPDVVMASIYQVIVDPLIPDEDDMGDDDSHIPTATTSDANLVRGLIVGTYENKGLGFWKDIL